MLLKFKVSDEINCYPHLDFHHSVRSNNSGHFLFRPRIYYNPLERSLKEYRVC